MIMKQTEQRHIELSKELHSKVMKYVHRKDFPLFTSERLYDYIEEFITKNVDLGEQWKEYYQDLDIPQDWKNDSWGNDDLPKFYHEKKKLIIWIDSKNVLERSFNTFDRVCSDCVKEIDGDTHIKLLKRFTIDRFDHDKDIGNGDRLLETNDFDEVVKFVNDYESK